MTEKEELELVALAAGYEIEPTSVGGIEYIFRVGELHPWRPRHDDGDSFRLMHKLKIYTDLSRGMVCGWDHRDRNICVRVDTFPTIDQLREAIYKVALEVGRRMKEQQA